MGTWVSRHHLRLAPSWRTHRLLNGPSRSRQEAKSLIERISTSGRPRAADRGPRSPGSLVRTIFAAFSGNDHSAHVVPSGWTFNTELGTLDVTGREVHATKKFRDVARSGKAAIVIDGLAPGAGFNPWAIEIAGPAEAITGPPALIRIHPDRVRSWGLDHAPIP